MYVLYIYPYFKKCEFVATLATLATKQNAALPHFVVIIVRGGSIVLKIY